MADAKRTRAAQNVLARVGEISSDTGAIATAVMGVGLAVVAGVEVLGELVDVLRAEKGADRG